MPSPGLVRAAFFAVGAVVGGGIATALSARQKSTPISVPSTPSQPVVEVEKTGTTRISTTGAQLVKVDLPVLKYGNPGELL